ncbi:MAG: UDP-glucose pyrophosphorylase [Microgenomates group bacterium GW2011_GWC1_37_12b]|uniref:UTP--glucose-1-phosphate uridylyltransferase n=1 Tax=Candidatus Woesebacteria bacterium GW2011_GWB1_38_8b TaxID=1618571 RepID=A0A0G0L6V2_9BACT|nr:MAG: UDP-glucose pyrophosphorylase [Microgenomates group bacterium GW2011_GWC1_37_12b]KKQ86737.1 MAG: UDP-glucose pyrophosphorylase [Candidatus Woesebacteria bacterium GW2011_GWB1_38_8b]
MKTRKKITKAVIAVAGYGTRFLPATKNQPKQMLPIIDKPIIHYVVEEAVNSGIEQIILVTQAGQHIMEDYFDSSFEIEQTLERSGKLDYLKIVQDIPLMANFIYMRQKKNLPYGNATPLLVAKDLIDKDEAFLYMFGDDMTLSHNHKPISKQLIDVFNQYHPSAVVGVQAVPWDQVHRYGTTKYKKDSIIPNEMEKGVEKVSRENAPSNMAQFGRYVLSYDAIKIAEETKIGKGNELWIVDILNNLVKSGKKVIAQPIDGEWLTTGDPLTYMQAQVRFTLERKDIGEEFKRYIKSLKL